ncbi:MAG: hypothetical protein ACREJU_11920 [Nitrospiraceae bacterium]
MHHRIYLAIVLPALIGMLFIMPVSANAEAEEHGQHHMKVTGVVTAEKSGLLTIKTPAGTLTTTANSALRHGHAVPKVGDEMTIWVNENNTVIDVHPKGQKGIHRFITGKLIYVGLMKKQIKLWTPEGEKVFPIERLEIKTGGIEEGALVTAEVNEAGTIIDLHRAESDGDKH